MPTKKATKTIAQNLEQLEALLQWFESDDVTVEVALEKYKQAADLAKVLEVQLSHAKNQVEIIKKQLNTNDNTT